MFGPHEWLSTGRWGILAAVVASPTPRALPASGTDNRVGDSVPKVVAPAGYELGRRLGEGAEGGAWAGVDLANGQPVILKPVAANALAAVRYAFGVLRRVASPHLPAVRALVVQPGAGGWLVTDSTQGDTLARGPVASQVAVGEAASIAHALAALHAAGTHHGDVAPANVVVTGEGPVLVDLGQLGRSGIGTPGFIAPEVLAGGGGASADLFALGSLLCWRLYGEAPWRRPEQLVRLTRDDVQRRLAQLDALRPPGSTPTGAGLRRLLARLLDPDPRRRSTPAGVVAQYLCELARANVSGQDTDAVRWWVPRRWPYQGVQLGSAVKAVADGSLRLLVVSGPPHCGRRRVVRELVQRLQLAGTAARSVDADRLGALLAAGAENPSGHRDWLEAWISAPASTAPLGLRQVVVGRDGGQGIERSSQLRAGAALANTPLILAVDEDVATTLDGEPSIAVVRVRPWTKAEVATAVEAVLEVRADELHAWVEALLQATGGWPAAVVRAVLACAQAHLQAPSDGGVAAAIQAMSVTADGDAPVLDNSVAESVLRACWDTQHLDLVPPYLRDGVRPYASAQAIARASLGHTRVRACARAALKDGVESSLALAVDAACPAALARALGVEDCPRRSDVLYALDWVEREVAAGNEFDAPVVLWAMRVLLAQGDATKALVLVESLARVAAVGDAVGFERARALQRLGNIDEALAVLGDPQWGAADAQGEHLRRQGTGAQVDDALWRRRGLRWRLLADRGDASVACSEAQAAGIDQALHVAGGTAVGLATAMLWAAYAALVVGDRESAKTRLARAQPCVAGPAGVEAAGVLARIAQLRGNLRHDEGELGAAAVFFDEAATAFSRADEPIGNLAVRGSLSGLAIPTANTTVGIEHGRAAVRGLMARGQRSALSEAAINLVQLLARVGAAEEAHTVRRALAELGEGPQGRDAARLCRIDAELTAMRLTHRMAPRPTLLAAELEFVAAAQALAAAQLCAEAGEAWLRAAALARIAGRIGQARLHVSAARTVHTDVQGGPAWVAACTAEQVCLAANAGDAELVAALARLRAAGTCSQWLARNRLELAWACDQAQLIALRQWLPAGDPRRRVLARRMTQTLELMMSKVKTIDRSAARTSVVNEGGEPGVLRELLDELEGDGDGHVVGAAGHATSEPREPLTVTSDGGPPQPLRFERLLRMYRRFSREDRLEPLLEQVIDAMMDLTDAERGAVVVVRPDQTRFEVTRELTAGSEGAKFSQSVIQRVLDTGEPVLSVDAAADERFDSSRSISHLNLRSVLAVPLRFRGKTLGAAYVDHRLRRGNFDEGDLAHAEAFSELAALAVAHAAVLGEVRTQADRLRAQQQELARLLEQRDAEVVALREDVRRVTPDSGTYRGIVGSSVAIRRVFRLIDRLASSDVPVVVYGESGTGKELVARALHEAGPRAQGPFVAENCAAIPETLLESVLFGHARGAFTGAQKAKVGLFEAANGGSIFLDEVGEMAAAMQTKLLRVLQEGEVRRVGENLARKVDVRVIAASNRDLQHLVETGVFRRDLYYRIHVVRLDLPPLRERVEDIPGLVQHFLDRHGHGKSLVIDPAVMRGLCAHQWPGNIRELENEVLRWLVLCDGRVGSVDLSDAITGLHAAPGVDVDDLRIRPRVERLERELIARALEQHSGNQTHAAQALGLSRYGLQKKLKRMPSELAERS